MNRLLNVLTFVTSVDERQNSDKKFSHRECNVVEQPHTILGLSDRTGTEQ